MARAAYTKDNYPGNAVPSTLDADISSSATSFNITPATNWSATNLWAVINPGPDNAKEEHIWIGTNSSGALSGVVRNINGSGPHEHSSGDTIKVIASNVALDEMSKAVNETVGAVTTQGDILVASAANTLGRLGVGATGTVPQSNGTTLSYAKVDEDNLATGIVPVYSQATAPATPAEGWLHFDTDTDLLYFYDGAAWVPVSGQVIDRVDLSVAGSITLTPVAGFSALEIVYQIRSTIVASADSLSIYFDGDTTAGNYHRQLIIGSNGTAANTEAADSNIARVPGASSLTNAYGHGTIKIVGYDEASALKSAFSTYISPEAANTVATGVQGVIHESGAADAISTSILLQAGSDLAAGSWAELRGI